MATIVSASPSAATPFQFSSLSEANSYRLKAIVERLTFIMNSKSGGIRFDSSEFFSLCFALARGVDCALTINDVPGVSHRLPSLIKQVYQRRNESSLQPAIMMLMISVKNACKNRWFVTAHADELLNMTNELFSSFCMATSVSHVADSALDIIYHLTSRFYPQFKLGSLLISFEAKPGYEILMSDFQIPRNIPSEEKIMLVAVQRDNLETSSCIISPPQVSFLVNGKGVDGRTNISPDSGPQFPTDITKMLKYGTNIIQSIGYFTGTYLITLAFMSQITLSNTPILKDYVQSVAATAASDSEIIEGASRITLNCPISFRRIKTPVKGHLCKHHQCFDYENFITMNSRKPSWRCPFCNQPVSFIDMRMDQNMVKILKEVGEDVIDIVISADGSWKVVAEHNGNKDQQDKENVSGQLDCNIESVSPRTANTVVDAVDLTMGEDGKSESAVSSSQSKNHAADIVDTKPFKNTLDFPVHQFLAESTPTFPLQNAMWSSILSSISASNDACGVDLSESALPSVLANPVTTDDVSHANNQDPPTIPESSHPNLTSQYLSQVRPFAESLHLPPRFGNSMIIHESERPPIPRHVSRTPIAVQALAVPTQPPSSFKRMRINGPNSSSNYSSSATCQTIHPVTVSGDMERQHALRTSDLSMTQQDTRTSASQHVVSLPAPNLITSLRLPSIPRGAGAYRASSSSVGQVPSRNLSNLRSVIMPDTFNVSSSALPLDAARELLARQITQCKSQLQARAVNPQASRLSIGESSQNLPELPHDKNWRPTGRMRGSLTGSAYSAALHQYVAPTMTQVKSSTTPKPAISVMASTFSEHPLGGNGSQNDLGGESI